MKLPRCGTAVGGLRTQLTADAVLRGGTCLRGYGDDSTLASQEMASQRTDVMRRTRELQLPGLLSINQSMFYLVFVPYLLIVPESRRF